MRAADNFAAKVEQKIQEREAFKAWHAQVTGDCLLDVNEQLALREAGLNHASVAAITGVPDEVATAALDQLFKLGMKTGVPPYYREMVEGIEQMDWDAFDGSSDPEAIRAELEAIEEGIRELVRFCVRTRFYLGEIREFRERAMAAGQKLEDAKARLMELLEAQR